MSVTSMARMFCRFPSKGLLVGQVRFGGTIPVILIQDIEKRGSKGDVIDVKRGFARNVLIPRKAAGKYLQSLD